MCCTLQECEGLRSIADTKEPCGCGVLSRSVRVKERSQQKRALWVCCTLQECKGLRSKADTKEPCGLWCTFQECERLSNIAYKKNPVGVVNFLAGV